jgi:Sulfotransferase family
MTAMPFRPPAGLAHEGARTLPSFLILGAAKAGTTALYHFLNQHPEIGMSRIKEPNYFALAQAPAAFRGPGDADWINRFSISDPGEYRRLFDGKPTARRFGEASALYLYSPRAAPAVQTALPAARLVAILRHPADRAYSAYLHLVGDQREPIGCFEEALRREEERIRAGWEHLWHYQRMGCYYTQLRRYYARFDAAQIRVYLYEEFAARPAALLHDLFHFLEIDPTFRPDVSERHNARLIPPDRKPPFPPELRARLCASYREEILRLQDLIQRDLSLWLAAPTARAAA